MQIRGQLHASVAFPHGNRPRDHWIKEQVGLKAGLHALEKGEMLSLLGIEPRTVQPVATSTIIITHIFIPLYRLRSRLKRDVSDLYVGGGRLESRPGQRLSRTRCMWFFSAPPPTRRKPEQYSKYRHDSALSSPFQFIIHYNPLHIRHIIVRKVKVLP
jgi:hypothetical protein